MGRLELYAAEAIATAIAGMLHLMMGPNSFGVNINQGILFIVGGIAQIFWIIPWMFKNCHSDTSNKDAMRGKVWK
jgi:hypothetical protein